MEFKMAVLAQLRFDSIVWCWKLPRTKNEEIKQGDNQPRHFRGKKMHGGNSNFNRKDFKKNPVSVLDVYGKVVDKCAKQGQINK